MKTKNNPEYKREDDPDFKVECSMCHKLIYGGYLDSKGRCVKCRPKYK